MAQRVVTVNELLDGHIRLDIECLDRRYLNAYAPILQTNAAQVMAFFSRHLCSSSFAGVVPPAGDRLRRPVASAEANEIPWVGCAAATQDRPMVAARARCHRWQAVSECRTLAVSPIRR
jgi:hypothetical protein